MLKAVLTAVLFSDLGAVPDFEQLHVLSGPRFSRLNSISFFYHFYHAHDNLFFISMNRIYDAMNSSFPGTSGWSIT